MSNLQIGLAIAGGILLAGIVAHSAWNSRKNAPRQAAPVDDNEGTPQEMQEPLLEPLLHNPEQPVNDGLPTAATVRKPAMDALIDVIAALTLDPAAGPVTGEAAIAALPATRRAGTKPLSIEGFNLATQAWELPTPGQRYSSFQAGVQLANRSGALNEIEYSEFVVKTQAFADAIGAVPEFPEMRDEVARARELDQFAAAHDAQLGFTIRARNASWSPGYVQQNAARLGFVPGAIAGRMVLPSATEGAPPILALSFDAQAAMSDDLTLSAIRELQLKLDVAHVHRAEQAFGRMREAALALANGMDGMVTDDNGEPLAPQTLEIIGAELQGLYDTLEQRDLAAGSPLARRLFS